MRFWSRQFTCVFHRSHGCAHCLDLHTRDLTKKRVELDKLALVQVWCESGFVFGERERAALRWAETVTLVADTGIPEEDFRAVSIVFSEKEIVGRHSTGFRSVQVDRGSHKA
jgi:alkylhydroperoxidase family enzyme